MGGYNSGRYMRLGVKNSKRVNHYRAVDIRQVRKQYGLGAGEPARFEFFYGINGGPRSIRFSASIVWAAYHFGQRPFFACPRCHRRCCKLYLAEVCACRQCLGLTYPIQFETKVDQLYRRAWKARSRLSPPDGHSGPGDFIPSWKKPKGMHWKTFYRLRDAADQKAVPVYAKLATKLGL